MNSYYYQKLWGKYYPTILCLLCMLVHFLFAYPGGMSSDTFDQYNQSITGNYNSHHPPLMAIVWSLLHLIYQGPSTMLLLNLAPLWGGVLLLFYSDPKNKYRYLYFIIPFSPNILSQASVIWKDVAFAFSSFLVVASCIFYTYKQRAPSILVVTCLLLLVFYAVGVKFQAQFIAPILILFIVSLYIKKSLVGRMIVTTILSIVIIYGNAVVIKQFSIEANSHQLRQLFDLAGVATTINNDELIPNYIKEDTNLYSFEKLKKYYNPASVDRLIFGDNRIYCSTSDPQKLQEMQRAYIQAITKYPLAYLKHRGKNFIKLIMFSSYHYENLLIDNNEARKYGFHFQESPLKNIMLKYLKIFPRALFNNCINFILMGTYLITILIHRKQNYVEITILSYIVAISVVFSIVLFFATMASDYRYYCVVRVLTLLTFPIYFNLYKKVRINAVNSTP